MDDSEYMELLLKNLNNSNKSGINSYLQWLYKKVDANLKGENVLEIGAGAGLSRNFISYENHICTDILPWVDSKILGGVDAQNLPFPPNYFDSAFAVDAIHHILFPAQAIIELCRVVKPGGHIVIVEPYVSFLSFPIYKLFHDESTTWNYKLPDNGKIHSNSASEGEQSVLQALFANQKIVETITLISQKNLTYERLFFSPLSFFVTGGLNKPLPVSSVIVQFIIKIESLIPKKLMKLLAARQILLITLN